MRQTTNLARCRWSEPAVFWARWPRRNALFHKLLQALIELAPAGSEERSLLESISNHVAGRGVTAPQLFKID